MNDDVLIVLAICLPAIIGVVLVLIDELGVVTALQRFFLLLVDGLKRVFNAIAASLRPTPVRRPLTAREEAHLEHDAFDSELIERMRDLGTLNHTISCFYCRSHRDTELAAWAYGRITPGEITGERISTLERRENTYEEMIANVLGAMQAYSR